jgi:hypothetical protein
MPLCTDAFGGKAVLLATTSLLVVATTANAQSAFTRCPTVGDAILVEISVAGCDSARAVATALTSASGTSSEAVLRAAGWTALRAAASDAGRFHDIVAIRGRAALRIRRVGAAPDLDG